MAMHVWWAERSGLLNISLPALSPCHCTANKMETLKKISVLWQARVTSPESGCQFSISRNPQCLHLPLRVWKQLCDDVRPKARLSLQNREVRWCVWPGGWKWGLEFDIDDFCSSMLHNEIYIHTEKVQGIVLPKMSILSSYTSFMFKI